MLNFLKTLVGAGSMAISSTVTGATYLQSELKKAGANPDALPAQLYCDLAEHAKRHADNMAELMPEDKAVTHFGHALDYIAIALADLLAGEPIEVDDGVADVISRHGVAFQRGARRY